MNEHTTADYLNQLEQDRQDLVDNLETKGITGLSGDETFTELVPEVLNISGGADLDDYFSNVVKNGNPNEVTHSYLLRMIKKVPDDIVIEGTDLSYAFNGATALTEIPFIDTTGVTNFASMFSGCKSLTTVPLLNTSSATNARYMFYDCYALTEIPLLDTSNVTNMQNMFSSCKSMISLPELNTSNVTNMSSMCQGCTELANIPLLNTSKVTNMSYMFSGCKKFTTESLNNLLGMCANVDASYSNTKKLSNILGGNYFYPAATIQSLSNYQAFIDAGWTIGWE